MVVSKYYFMYDLREVSTVCKMNITIEVSKFLSEDQFDARKDQNLKLQFKHAF